MPRHTERSLRPGFASGRREPDARGAATRGLPIVYLLLAGVVAILALVDGRIARWPGVTHLVALPPLDVFADVRALLVLSPGHPFFWLAAVAMLAARCGLMAVLLGRERARLIVVFYGVTWPLALVAAQLTFIAHAALYSRLFWGAVAVTGVIAALLAAAPWTGRTRLTTAVATAARQGFRLPVLAGYAAALVAIGGAAARWPGLAPGLVVASALATSTTIVVLARPARQRPWIGTTTVIALGVLIAVFTVVTRGTEPPASAPARQGSLLVMSGINSSSGEGAIFELDPGIIGFSCDQTYYYSYAGPGDGQPRGEAACPIRTGAPYQPHHTQRPFDEQVDALRAQSAQLEEPVLIAAHSQAAWVVWQARAEDVLPAETHLVLVGPFPSSPVGYPEPGAGGPGRVGADGFRLVEPVILAADFHFEVDAPLSHEVLATPDAAREIVARPLPAPTPVLSVTAVPDLALMPDGPRIHGARNACPVREAHPYLPLTPALHREIIRFLEGEPPRSCPVWRTVADDVSLPWGVPPQR